MIPMIKLMNQNESGIKFRGVIGLRHWESKLWCIDTWKELFICL